jgi:ABC-2 type transport system permease protein
MLWYKSWLETRWRFVIGLILLMLSAAATVLAYPQVVKLLPMVSNVDLSGEIGRRITESLLLARDYRGYVWSQWFGQKMTQQWSLFAVLLGTGGLLAQSSGGGALFTLSLPVSRNRLLGVRAATGLAELLLLALVPSLLIPVLSPTIGHTYGIGDALVHSACMFIAGSVLFCLAFLLSTVFSDVWRPLLIVLCVAIVLGLSEYVFPDLAPYSLFRVMSAEVYFRGGGLPWLGLLASAALSVVMLYAATRNIARQDF